MFNFMDKKKYLWIWVFLIVVILIIAIVVMLNKRQDRVQQTDAEIEQKEDVISAKQLEKEYNSIIVGDKTNLDKKNATSIKEIDKKLGKPVTENVAFDKVSTSVKTWASGASNELPANLSVSVIDDAVVEKNISNLYVKPDKNKVITNKKFNEINVNPNSNFTMEEAVKEFGEPNNMSQYINESGEEVNTFTWDSNVSGPIGSFCSVIFANDKAISKNELGLS